MSIGRDVYIYIFVVIIVIIFMISIFREFLDEPSVSGEDSCDRDGQDQST